MIAIPRRTLITIGIYAAFFVVCYGIFLQRTFPYERLRDVIVSKVAAPDGPSARPTKLSIAEIGPDWLTGVSLDRIVFERAAESSDDPPTKLALDRLVLHAEPLRFLFGNIGVNFDASLGPGDIEGSYRAKRDGVVQVDSKLDAIDVAKLGLGSALGIPLGGTAEGAIDVQLSDKPAETSGKVELQIAHLKLGDGKSKVRIPGMVGGLTLDAIDAGNTEIKLTIREGVATIDRLSAKGKDVELTGSGSFRLARTIAQSRIDLNLEVKFDKGYTQRSERTKVAFELMQASPIMARATAPDGTIRFRISGTFAMPHAAPAAGPGHS